MGIRKHIPNTITALNLACGAAGIAVASLGHIETAFILMLAGAVFDFCDGLSARALGAYSPMGKELDSIADTVTFGMLPAFMLFMVISRNLGFGVGSVLTWIPLLIAIFSGLRLAKFNIDERQTSSFIGLPTPACAMVCGSLAAFLEWSDRPFAAVWFVFHPYCIALGCLLLCFLLVCEIPMFSMKMHKGEGMNRDMILRIILAAVGIAALVAVIAAGWHWTMIFFITFTAYIIINLAAHAIVKKK